MSLVRTAVRLCAVAALRQRTWAEKRVYDSDNTPLSQAMTLDDEPSPYIVVYTDADSRMNIQGTEFYAAERNLSLVLEIAVASAVQVNDGPVEIRTPFTDEGMELAVDVTEMQALRALLGDPRSPWGELFKTFVIKIVRSPSTRGGQNEKGTRWAARQVVLVCDVMSDPPAGEPVAADHPLRQFIALAREDAASDLPEIANLIEMVIDQFDEYPSWEKAQGWLGLSKRAIRGIGMAPLVDPPTTAPLSGGTDIVDGSGEGPLIAEEEGSLNPLREAVP